MKLIGSHIVKSEVKVSQDARRFYYHYCRETKKHKHKRLSQGEYRKFLIRFHELLLDALCNEAFEFKMFARLGTLRMTKTELQASNYFHKTFKFMGRINWGETNKLWKECPEKKGKKYIHYSPLNVIYRLEWSRRIARFKNMNLYSFKPNRSTRFKMAEYINNNPNFDAYG